ncbi:MAG: DNA primase [Thermodesulfovibrio sp.]|nr:DNA primase [Thermodesulfovibrio sp.]
MKTDRILEDIKSRIDIIDLISEYVQLKKAGQNWKGLCPFHVEKTPSFTVSQAKQMFHCFGCSTGGDIFAFVMKHEHLSFQEALALLARKSGVSLPDAGSFRRTSERDEKVRSILLETRDYFSLQLERSQKAAAYVKGRGITEELLQSFRIGYAPDGWQNLLRHLRGKGFKDQEILESGLAVSGTKGLYDMFRNRVMFPITNMSGTVVAFGGRAFDDATPKYLNSPETAVFRKSETLFGLSHAKEQIRRENRVLIAEGYMDVVICHQFGFSNVVAPLGTSLTIAHIRKLRTMADRAVLVFDGDAAGKAAARRALPLICQNNFAASILVLPDQEDPDSYLKKNGAAAFSELLQHAQGMIGFLFSINQGDKLQTVREVLGLIASIGDLLTADEMLTELAETTRINETTLRDELKKMKAPVKGKSAAPPAREAGPLVRRNEEHLLLSAVLSAPGKAGYVLSRISVREIADKTVATLFSRMASLPAGKELLDVLEEAGEDEKKMVTMLSVDPGFDPEFIDRNIDDCLAKIEKRKLDEKVLLIERSDDPALSNAFLLEKQKLLKGTNL